jgi:hypothetical protein
MREGFDTVGKASALDRCTPPGDRGIGSAVERDILDRELAELALEWMMNPHSPPVPTCHENADIK